MNDEEKRDSYQAKRSKNAERVEAPVIAKGDNRRTGFDGTERQITGPDGRVVRLEDLPLVAYVLDCAHLGRDYAVSRRDLLFCRECGRQRRVSRIIAS
jgi:hypothetical protein